MVLMNDPEQLAKPGMELRRRPPPFGLGRPLVTYSLATVITTAMVVWVAVLSWGLLTALRWLLARCHLF
jgi:hypothetical protein